MKGIEASGIVSVVIINYNGRHFLQELLESLSRQSLQNFETLVIDNASSDGSTEYLRSHPFRVQLVALPKNLGFAEAANLGVRRSTGQYVALLNPDLRLDSGWLEHLVRSASADPKTGAVACKLLFYESPHRLNGVGGAMNLLGYTWDRGMNEEDRGQYDTPQEVLFASAGAGLFRRTAFLEVGGFDSRFFMYHEDVDLCWRLWLHGYRVITAPAAVAYHHFGGVTKVAKGLKWREIVGERNNIRSLLKNYELPNAARSLTKLILLPQSVSRKAAQLKNLLWNLIHVAETLRLRRRIQRQRVRSDSDLHHLIVQSTHVPVRL